jgi:hypothetical protein
MVILNLYNVFYRQILEQYKYKGKKINIFITCYLFYANNEKFLGVDLLFKGSVQRECRRVWSNISTRYLVWGCGDGRSFIL